MAKLRGVDGARWAVFKRLDIPEFENPSQIYLRRWRLLESPWFGVKLHHVLLPDGDRAMHDHPWSFVSLILHGGYSEDIIDKAGRRVRVCRRVGSLHRLRATGLHRITELHGDCWTLVVNGPRRREWGFVPDASWGEPGKIWVPWRQYIESVTSSGKAS